MILPGMSESDVAETDGSPGEQRSQTGKSLKPGEDSASIAVDTEVSEEADQDNGSNRGKWTARLVDVGKELGSETLLSEGDKSSATTVDTRNTNRQNGNQDDDVHERVVTLEASIGDGNDERRGARVVAASVQQSLIGRVDQKTDQKETNDVEEGDSPENLLDGARKGLGGVLGFSGGETNEFGTAERESGSDKDTYTVLDIIMRKPLLIVWYIPQNPRKPCWKAPGSYQSRAPQYS